MTHDTNQHDEIESISRELDKLGKQERASAPHGLAERVAARTAPLIAGRVRLVDAPRVRVRMSARSLAVAAGVALLMSVGAVILAMRPGSPTPTDGSNMVLAAETTLDDLDHFLAYGDMDNEIESLFVETELLSATLGLESSPWVNDAIEESL